MWGLEEDMLVYAHFVEESRISKIDERRLVCVYRLLLPSYSVVLSGLCDLHRQHLNINAACRLRTRMVRSPAVWKTLLASCVRLLISGRRNVGAYFTRDTHRWEVTRETTGRAV